jgi:long-chain fatty acid transport protein
MSIRARWVLAGVAVLSCAVTSFAQGLQYGEQGTKALGLGGAFVAQAADPSAIYYNPGALALLEKKKAASLGIVSSTTRQFLFQGLPPGVATATTGEQKNPRANLPFAYAVLPFGGRSVIGVGVYSPLRNDVDWADPGTYAGRFLAVQSTIKALDVAPAFSVQVTPSFGLGGTLIYRSSQLLASRRLGAILQGNTVDVGTLDLRTDTQSKIGWSAGFLYRPSPRFSFGASYKSAIDTTFRGVGKATQIASGNTQLDQLTAASIPFGSELPLSSRFRFPSQASVGLSFSPSDPLMFEIDARHTGWTTVQNVDFAFPSTPLFNTAYRLNLQDAWSYHGGFRLQFPTGPQLRLGYAFFKSPQPDSTVGAFIADSNRSSITLGFGLDWLDIAAAWTTYDQRIISTNVDGVNGNYRGNAWSLSLSATK